MASSGIVPEISPSNLTINPVAALGIAASLRNMPPRSSVDAVREAIRHLRRGYALVSTPYVAGDVPLSQDETEIHLAGYSVREICQIATSAGVPLEQLFLSGELVDFEQRGNARADPNYDVPDGVAMLHGRRVYAKLRRAFNVPLSEVEFPEEMADMPYNVTVEDILTRLDSLDLAASVGGSGALQSVFILWSDIRIVRRYPFPRSMRGDYSFRTGGFERLLLSDIEFTLPRFKNGKSVVYCPGTIERYSNGVKNCIFQCILWSLYQDVLESAASCSDSPLTREDKDELFGEVRNEVNHFYTMFFNKWKTERLGPSPPPPTPQQWTQRTHSVTVAYRAYAAKEKRLTREWNNLIRHGFSRTLIKRLTGYLAFHDINLHVYQWDWKKNLFTSVGESANSLGIRHFSHHQDGARNRIRNVSCFQVNINGDIQSSIISDGVTEAESAERQVQDGFSTYYSKDIFPGLLHAIALWPPIDHRVLTSPDNLETAQELQVALRGPLRDRLLVAFEENREKNLGLAANTARFAEVVELQRRRCRNDIAFGFNSNESSERRSALDMDEFGGSSGTLPDFHPAQAISAPSAIPPPPSYNTGVCVYDMETVENLRGRQDVVHDAFRQQAPFTSEESQTIGVSRDVYSPPQGQIPYSVQWGLVDMDFVEGRSGSSSVLLDGRVHLEFGKSGLNLLGECVEDFLRGLHENAIMRKYNRVYCYAHNGCGFDAYLVLRYIYSPDIVVKKLLITPRGILSLAIEIGGKSPTLIFRDTKVFFGARLADLCTIFKVPQQYCKTDFPITKVNVANYDDPRIRRAYREYCENDVWSLAYIVVGINRIIETEILRLPPGSLAPNRIYGICKYVTLMSLVTFLQRTLFTLKSAPAPTVVDIPALRNYVSYANMGGRVLPFWRSYRSSYAIELLRNLTMSWRAEKENGLLTFQELRNRRCEIHAKMLEEKEYAIVLDVTSLYPYTMSSYPMPTGSIMWIEDAKGLFYSKIIPTLGCVECFRLMTLCALHKETLDKQFPFTFFVIRNLSPELAARYRHVGESFPNDMDYVFQKMRNVCARKCAGGGVLLYNLLTTEEINTHANANELFGSKANVLPENFMCYTMYDLFWLHRFGWTFDIVAAFGFEATYIFRSKIQEMFESRKAAKVKEKANDLPKSLSTMWKNLYNGMYGINARKDIRRQYLVCADGETEGTLRSKCKICPDENVIYDSASHQLANSQWILKLEKHVDSAEYFAEQSPNQIGAAVTSTARHHMNLLIANMKVTEYGYTDTDSLFVTGAAFERLRTQNPKLFDERADADMGTYKNDHEGPNENIVFCSMLLAKKVKLHATLDRTGNIQFHDTFKGFNPSPYDAVSGDAIAPYEIQFLKVRAMSELFFDGVLSNEVSQTEWRRSLAEGVSIDKNAAFSGNESTYFNHSAGVLYIKNPKGGSIELLIPHGVLLPDAKKFKDDYERLGMKCAIGPAQMKEIYVFPDHLLDSTPHLAVPYSSDFYYTWRNLLWCWESLLKRTKEQDNDRIDDGDNIDEARWRELFDAAPKLTPADYKWVH